MCTNKTWIIDPRGRKQLVRCGKCPACKQEKAVARANRIRNNITPSHTYLFITLTYRNDCCPYILRSDLENPLNIKENLDYVNYISDDTVKDSPKSRDLKVFKKISARMSCPDDKVKFFRDIPIYRDSVNRWVRAKGKSTRRYRMRRKVTKITEQLSEVSVPLGFEKCWFKSLRNYDINKIGVCYYPDVQNFIKNLRNVLVRNCRVSDNFSFYCCSEYGPTTCRPHFHLLLACPSALIKQYKFACRKAWPYDDYRSDERFCEIARDAAAYVSSYVNCDSSVPVMFENVRAFRPLHSYSKGFGMGIEYLQLPKILQAYERGDLHVNITRIRKGTIVVDRVLLPKYAIHRFFPKWKGYYKLTSDEIQSILFRPESLNRYKMLLDLDEGQLHQIKVNILNKQKRFIAYGYNAFDFALVGSRVWSVYASNLMSDFYNSLVLPVNNFQAYDNIKDLFESSVSNESLENLMLQVPPDYHFETDPNLFKDNFLKSSNLSRWYYEYTKDKKIRNGIYSNHFNI